MKENPTEAAGAGLLFMQNYGNKDAPRPCFSRESLLCYGFRAKRRE
jgi:hypothetical protein